MKDKIYKKIKFIINIMISIAILLTICCIIAQLLGLDLQSYKLIHILGLDGDVQELMWWLIFYVFTFVICNFDVERLLEKIESRGEYREYLLKELGDDVLGESSEDKEEGKESDDDRGDKTLNGIINEQRKNDKKDIIALMLKNNDETTEYFKISKSQAKSSFWFSVISCIVGMVALAVGIYGIVILKNISVSVIGLISGSISELISGTIFWVHNKSALQLNHYYDALHENEKFLSAVNIADKLSDEKREEVLVEIIHKQINSESSKTKTEKTKEKRKKIKIDESKQKI